MATNELIEALAQLLYWNEFNNDEKSLYRLVAMNIIDEDDVDLIIEKKDEIERREDAANYTYDRLRDEGYFNKRF